MASGIGAISESASRLADTAGVIGSKTVEKIDELDSSEKAMFDFAMKIREANLKVDRQVKRSEALIDAYSVAAADGNIGPKELGQLNKLAKGTVGRFSSAFKVAAAEDGISSAEIIALNKLLGIEDSFTATKK